ncbi:efflux RND transporter periplasmic adaptor subunit [Ruegeria atlantica]|uniref:Macrolide transporter subunit MacA n=1 Tax=Ruegeria atlantica TaxID=81569 RepID=A0A0P1E935_9RHOB|nr:HlyD family efflux transporter periplasmic adaptor subunit [Ruegeria atlantica]CUH44677.1 macrolide transporter subunit MacA [Ruegeria atlantica]
MAHKKSRWVLSSVTLVILAVVLLAAFWPRAVAVDLAQVEVGDLIVTVDEEGRTRVHDSYVVATPVAGRLLRVGVEPGDPVVADQTVIARMSPTNPSMLDVRTREQARAAVTAAEAALRVSRADLNKAIADLALAEKDMERAESLMENGRISESALARAEREARVAQAVVDSAEAAISVRTAELTNARAQLIRFDGPGIASALAAQSDEVIPLLAPATGRVLQVIQQNEITLPAGAPILEIGDIDGDLEVVAELLSSDAVQVSEGDRVIIDEWGGGKPIDGTVERIDPLGFTKFSALGVEEQRVNVVISMETPDLSIGRLGHGYRVEVRIVIQEDPDALIIPASAMFRTQQDWFVFLVEDGKISAQPIEVAATNGVQASVASGLNADDVIVLYPSTGLVAGTRVAKR